MSEFTFVQVNQFQPNHDGWNEIGAVSYQKLDNCNILLTNKSGYQIKVSFLSPTAIRVRFNPVVSPDYTKNNSYAVVNRNLGTVSPVITELTDGGGALHVNTGELDVYIGLAPYGISVHKDGKVITEDEYGKNLIFSNEATANLKKSPNTESYFGFGEKAGALLDKKKETMTFFNYDNFTYNNIDAEGGSVVPDKNAGGPLNPTSPLYNSMPYTLAIGKSQQGIDYAYGLYFDNVSQSYFNMGTNKYAGRNSANMNGKYYFGALYGEMDYYIMVGSKEDGSKNIVASVIQQYSKLTGQAAMPPMYALGYQQGCYGYYDRAVLENVAQQYRENNIPIDGLHIDVDFQDNYRTFTSSKVKFPNVKEMFDNLHEQGFKCSTNITGIVTANPYDENGSTDTPYPTRDNLVALNPDNAMQSKYKDGALEAFIWNTRDDQGESSEIFMANENYGTNDGFNPYQKYYPSPSYPEGNNELGTYGYYSDMGREDVQKYWGQQYDYLLRQGLDMIWQDMTCPAVVPNVDNGNPDKTLPLDLMMYDKVTEAYQPNVKIHNAFSLNLVQATYEGLTALKTSDDYKGLYNYNKRNFIISRGGFAGVHRYAGIWTGDSASSWDFLKINIPEVLNTGLSGLAIAGCDIGGFANGSGSIDIGNNKGITDPELYTRWMTAGAFLPWYRNHYDGYTKSFQEPYRYGEPVISACRKYIEIRYQLLQLFYDCMYENTQSGMPVARAMFLNEPNDLNVFSYSDQQFFIGDNLMVAPVTDQNWHKTIYLPNDSQWFVFDTKGGKLPQATQGGKAYTWYVPLDIVPLYIREGAIIPVRQLEQYVGQLEKNYLDFYVYPGKNSSYQLYLDDKVSMDAERLDLYRTTMITSENTETGKQVVFKRTHDNFTPAEEYFHVSFLGINREPTNVVVNKKQLQQVSEKEMATASKDAFYYDAVNEKIVVKVFDKAKVISVTANYLTKQKESFMSTEKFDFAHN